MASGLITYLALSPFNIPFFGEFGEVVVALCMSLIFMVGGSLFFHVKRDQRMLEVFFPERTPSTTAAVYEFEQSSSSSPTVHRDEPVPPGPDLTQS